MCRTETTLWPVCGHISITILSECENPLQCDQLSDPLIEMDHGCCTECAEYPYEIEVRNEEDMLTRRPLGGEVPAAQALRLQDMVERFHTALLGSNDNFQDLFARFSRLCEVVLRIPPTTFDTVTPEARESYYSTVTAALQFRVDRTHAEYRRLRNELGAFDAEQREHYQQHADRDRQNFIFRGRDQIRQIAIRMLMRKIDASILDQEDQNCHICQDKFGVTHEDKDAEVPVRLLCGHLFGSNCVLDWLTDNSSCPTCRRDFQTEIDHGPMIATFEQLSRLERAVVDGIVSDEGITFQAP